MADSPFADAGDRILASLAAGLHDAGKEIMKVSLVEVPRSDGSTYITEWGTRWRTIDGKRVEFTDEDETPIVGDDGTLFRSARLFPTVVSGDEMTVEMGYGFGEEVNPAGRLAADYAYWVHEVVEYKHEPPTKSGFLLDPVLEHAGSFAYELGMRIRGFGEGFPLEQSYGAAVADGQDLGAE